MNNKFTYRKYKKGDEKKIVELWLKVFAEVPVDKMDLKSWEWFYGDSLLKNSRIWLAFDDERLVSHYAIVPFEFWLGDKKVIVGIAPDFMTDQEYRGRNIFYKLANLAYEDSKDLYFLYAYPNNISYPIFKKILKWDDVSITPLLIKPLDIAGFLTNNKVPRVLAKIAGLPFKAFNIIKKKRKFDIKEVQHFDNKVEKLLKKCFKPKIGQVKSEKYLNWRFTKHPNRRYNIFVVEEKNEWLGYITCRFSNQNNSLIGIIMDIAGINNMVTDTLISHCLDYFKEKKAHFAMCMISSNNPYYKRFYYNGFFRLPELINPKKWTLTVRFNNKEQSEHVLNSKNWFVTWSDNDVL